MMKKLSIFTLTILLVLNFAYAASPSYKGKPMTPQKAITPSTPAPELDGIPGMYHPYEPAEDLIGEAILCGTTWYDIQHNGTCGRQAQVDTDGWTHVAWMNGLDNGATQRHIYYQLIDPAGATQFTGGVQVDNLPRAGYNDLVLLPDNRGIPIHHQGGTENFHTAVSHDFIPYIGAFMTSDLPWVYEGGVDIEVIWPKAAIDINERIHIISHENPPGGTTERPQKNFYGWAEYNSSSMEMEFCEEQEFTFWTNVIASTVAASPVSDRVAIGYLEMNATSQDSNQYDNDICVIISEDGLSWDWADTINITNWIPPDLTQPDTLHMNMDTLRCYPDVHIMFDNDDVMHVFFSSRGYYSLEGTLTYGNGFIWHWDERYQVYSVVANAWFENTGALDPGAWNVYANRPQAAIDPQTGDIYCMYQRYVNPVDTSELGFPYLIGDDTDVSLAGFPNGEIWVTKSIDGGYTWAEGINVTETASPGAANGDCLSELTPSMSLNIQNGLLDIFYILDKDAGAIFQTEGGWSLNDVICQRVPIEAIPNGPPLRQYPMHVDSTGFPYGDSVVREIPGIVSDFTLEPAYPNPFNPSAEIRFSLNVSENISLNIYDIQGREVSSLFDGFQTAGSYSVMWNAQNFSSGIYFARLSSENGLTQTQKLVLMK